MFTVNMNTGDPHLKTMLYPDNQPHVSLSFGDSVLNHNANVVCSITSSLKLLQLQMVCDALDSEYCKKEVLYIPYLMGARFDRIMNYGDSFDLRVIAKVINGLGFNRVILLDPHSEVSLALISRSSARGTARLQDEYKEEKYVLIIPDAGAAKKQKAEWLNPRVEAIVTCEKHRDLKDGSITLRVPNPEVCDDKVCLIVDDLCDGGGTFLAIAGQIAPRKLTLMVTHGVFSKGFAELEKHFDEIITTNSYRLAYNSSIVKVVNYNEI